MSYGLQAAQTGPNRSVSIADVTRLLARGSTLSLQGGSYRPRVGARRQGYGPLVPTFPRPRQVDSHRPQVMACRQGCGPLVSGLCHGRPILLQSSQQEPARGHQFEPGSQWTRSSLQTSIEC
jgi:hypothetical protein